MSHHCDITTALIEVILIDTQDIDPKGSILPFLVHLIKKVKHIIAYLYSRTVGKYEIHQDVVAPWVRYSCGWNFSLEGNDSEFADYQA